MRRQVWSVALFSGLRIQCCHELWCRSQMGLGSHVAVGVACSYSSDLTPSLGTSTCRRYGPKETKKKKKILPMPFSLLPEAIGKKISLMLWIYWEWSLDYYYFYFFFMSKDSYYNVFIKISFVWLRVCLLVLETFSFHWEDIRCFCSLPNYPGESNAHSLIIMKSSA